MEPNKSPVQLTALTMNLGCLLYHNCSGFLSYCFSLQSLSLVAKPSGSFALSPTVKES